VSPPAAAEQRRCASPLARPSSATRRRAGFSAWSASLPRPCFTLWARRTPCPACSHSPTACPRPSVCWRTKSGVIIHVSVTCFLKNVILVCRLAKVSVSTGIFFCIQFLEFLLRIRIFGPPGFGSGSISQRYGSGSGSDSGSGSFYHQEKILRKP
jgi:uncharacterized membrane protein YgcG